MTAKLLAPLTDEMIAAINSGKVQVYLVGEISYTDVFKAWHTTRFFQRYVPAEQKFLAEQAMFLRFVAKTPRCSSFFHEFGQICIDFRPLKSKCRLR